MRERKKKVKQKPQEQQAMKEQFFVLI